MKTRFNSIRPRFLLAWRFGSLLLLAVATRFIHPACAQTNPSPAISSNRFLFILDTSAAMKRKLPDILKAVDAIVASSASGQLRSGDTVGLWTFNSEVYAEFPLQTWGEVSPADFSLLVKSFLGHRRFTNSANLDKALHEMLGVMQASDIITVALVYGGEKNFKGTPFDSQINDYLKHNVKPAKGDGVPAVVVLESRRGTIFNYAVAASPWPVEFPPLPQPVPLPVVKPTPPPVVETAKPPAPVTILPPLILSGAHPPTSAPPTSVEAQTAQVSPVQKTAPPVLVANPEPVRVPEPLPPPTPLETVAVPISTPQPPAIGAAPSAPPSEPATPPANQRPTEAVSQVQTPVTLEAAASSTPTNAITNAPINPLLVATTALPVTRRPVGFLIIGLVLAAVAAGLIGLMLRRSRRRSGASFISRSIANKK